MRDAVRASLAGNGCTAGADVRSRFEVDVAGAFSRRAPGFAPAFELSRFAIDTHSQYQAWEWE
jgi:hypothetical protein